jgi:outer membrane lipoprotein-sorting protein
MIVRTLPLLAAVALAAIAASAQLPPPPGQAPPPAVNQAQLITGAERDALVNRASRALEQIRTVEATFRQVSPKGAVTTGTLTLARPGRLRIDYDAPSPLLVVSDGARVTISDRKFKTADSVPLQATPLFFILKSNVNLARDAMVTDVARQGEAVFITARDRKRKIDGQITIELRGPNLQLAGWRIVDGQSGATSISLLETRTPARIDPKLFVIEDKADPTQRRRG